jgi:hypothetical protein
MQALEKPKKTPKTRGFLLCKIITAKEFVEPLVKKKKYQKDKSENCRTVAD